MIMCMIIKKRKTESWPKLQDGVSEMEFTLPKGCSKFQVIEISSLEGKSLADRSNEKTGVKLSAQAQHLPSVWWRFVVIIKDDDT